MVPKTVRKGEILDLDIKLSEFVNSLNIFVTSNKLVEDIMMQNNIRPK